MLASRIITTLCLLLALKSSPRAEDDAMGTFGPPPSNQAAILDLLVAGNFAELENLAATYTRDRTHFVGGGDGTAIFYSSFTAPDDAMFKVYFGRLASWRAAYPDSPTAHLATARMWNEYAALARREGGPGARELSDDRNRNAIEEFAQVDPNIDDPFRYGMLFKVTRDTTDDQAALDRVFHEEIARFPTYWAAYLGRAGSLGPDYGGTLQAEYDFANAQLQSPDLDNEQIGYWCIAVDLVRDHIDETIIGPGKLQWEPVHRGAALNAQRYGMFDESWESLARLATMAGDKRTARAALAEAHGAYDATYWGNRARFDQAVAWMNAP